MDNQHWTPKLVAVSLEEAADTLRRLPDPRLQGYWSSWPVIVRDFWEAYGWNDVRVRPSPPSPAAIDRMDEVLPWLQWLEPDDARLVWQRANGRPWKLIAYEFGVNRTTAWRRWTFAVILIATKLNTLKSKGNCRNTVATRKGATRGPRDGKVMAE